MEVLIAKDNEILKECLKVRHDVFTVEKNIPESIEVDELDCISSACDHVLVRYHHKNVGALRCKYVDNTTIKIQRFCFYSDQRRNGLGSKTLQYLEKYYKERGISKIILDSKFEVYKFYEKNNYIKVSDVFIEAGIEHVTMEKILI